MDKQRRKVMMNYEEYGPYYGGYGGYKRKGRRASVRRQGRSSKSKKSKKSGTFDERASRMSKAEIKSSQMMSKKPVVRSHFPETWLFHMEMVDKNGEASVSLKALDNFTL